MEHGLLAKSPRIEVVDALRGFAVMAIMLLHNIEHFNFYDFPTASSAFMEAMDIRNMGNIVFPLFRESLRDFLPAVRIQLFYSI